MIDRVRRVILAAPLAILLIAGGCKEAAPLESTVCENVPTMAMRGRVTDAANILTEAEETRLSDRLATYEKQTKHQMVVATTPSLYGVRVDNFGTCLGNRWGIGRKDADDGILILVAPYERQMRIATGTGMEKILTDDEALLVVKRMTQYFTSADYAAGLSTGIEAIALQTGEAR